MRTTSIWFITCIGYIALAGIIGCEFVGFAEGAEVAAARSARSLYFSEQGRANANCSETKTCEMNRLKREIERARAGDTFYLKSGDTFQNPCPMVNAKSGTRRQKITLTSYGRGRRPILQGCRKGLEVRNSDWWVIKDIEFKGAGNALHLEGVRNWTIDGNWFNDLDHTCIGLYQKKAKKRQWRNANIDIINNKCYDTGKGGHGEGIYLHPGGSNRRITIRNNEFYRLRDEGVN